MKKDKRRLVLNGSDDAYARREAAKDGGTAAEHSTETHPEPIRAAAPLQKELAFRPKREPMPRNERSEARGPVESASTRQKTVQTIQVNYRLNLGQKLSERLQLLADAHDQPIELIMKGLRTKAADRFKGLATEGTKPPIPISETGGKSIRYAAAVSGDLAKNLNAWFDPFGLGVAKDACKPILIELFQEEARALCDAAEGLKSPPE